MIRDYVTNLAEQSGITLSEIRIIEGREVGCCDVHLLYLSHGKHLVSALLYQSDIDALLSDSCCKRLDKRLHKAFSRLRTLFAS